MTRRDCNQIERISRKAIAFSQLGKGKTVYDCQNLDTHNWLVSRWRCSVDVLQRCQQCFFLCPVLKRRPDTPCIFTGLVTKIPASVAYVATVALSKKCLLHLLSNDLFDRFDCHGKPRRPKWILENTKLLLCARKEWCRLKSSRQE